MDQTQAAQLATAQGMSQEALTNMAVGYAGMAARGFDGWYDHSQIAIWATELSQMIEAIQGQAASSTDAYLTALLSEMKGHSVNPFGPVNVAGLRVGANHVEVYGRAADTYRYQVSLGKDPEQAQEMAVQRAQVMAQTDVQLAQRAQSQKFMVVNKVTGYRRIIHPELSKGGTCGLCIAASSRFYHRGDLMPIHNRCCCTTSPIVNSVDPGTVLNKDDLTALYKQAGSTLGSQLKKVRYTIHDNGEIGPVLAPHGVPYRGPSDLPAAA
jgi:hypothetical protein